VLVSIEYRITYITHEAWIEIYSDFLKNGFRLRKQFEWRKAPAADANAALRLLVQPYNKDEDDYFLSCS
jgi:hypothetical protein